MMRGSITRAHEVRCYVTLCGHAMTYYNGDMRSAAEEFRKAGWVKTAAGWQCPFHVRADARATIAEREAKTYNKDGTLRKPTARRRAAQRGSLGPMEGSHG